MNLLTSLIVLTLAVACGASWSSWGPCINNWKMSTNSKTGARKEEWCFMASWSAWSACSNGKSYSYYPGKSPREKSCVEAPETWGAWSKCVNGESKSISSKFRMMVKKCVAANTVQSWGLWGPCKQDVGKKTGLRKRFWLPLKFRWEFKECVAGIKEEGKPKPGAEQRALDKHNEYRKLHGKKPLKWNSRIAASALEWVKKQSYSNKGDMVHSAGTGFGENMAWAMNPTPGTEGSEAVVNWYNEICLYNSCTKLVTKATGHFTQVIWGESEYLGCGTHKNENGFFTVCQYYPPGNYEGQYCKQVGKPITMKTQKTKAGCKKKKDPVMDDLRIEDFNAEANDDDDDKNSLNWFYDNLFKK